MSSELATAAATSALTGGIPLSLDGSPITGGQAGPSSTGDFWADSGTGFGDFNMQSDTKTLYVLGGVAALGLIVWYLGRR